MTWTCHANYSRNNQEIIDLFYIIESFIRFHFVITDIKASKKVTYINNL